MVIDASTSASSAIPLRRAGFRLRPPQLLVLGFAGLIFVGMLLLKLPFAGSGRSLTWVEALFTATSAVCVTGLVVVDTGADLSAFGQTVVLFLFQTGGLGIMTVSTLFLLAAGGRPSLAAAEATGSALGEDGVLSVRGTVKRVVATTVAVELVGIGLLFLFFIRHGPRGAGGAGVAWWSVFHAVSAFCNAGFCLSAASLGQYAGDAAVSLTVMLLVITGGIGFPVLRDLARRLAWRFRRTAAEDGEPPPRPRLSLHTKLVLAITGTLLLAGALMTLVLEWDGALGGLSPGGKILASFFLSTTARTAGFNTVATSGLGLAVLFGVMLMMFVGASPGSTGGGVKTTTAGVLFVAAFSRLRGRPEPGAFGRSIGGQVLWKAAVVILMGGSVLASLTWLLLVFEGGNFALHRLLFEAFSAFGTVGLSTGITRELGTLARLVLVALMFIGRLGPLSVALAISRKGLPAKLSYPAENVLIG